jgi:hypothetical protein
MKQLHPQPVQSEWKPQNVGTHTEHTATEAFPATPKHTASPSNNTHRRIPTPS